MKSFLRERECIVEEKRMDRGEERKKKKEKRKKRGGPRRISNSTGIQMKGGKSE